MLFSVLGFSHDWGDIIFAGFTYNHLLKLSNNEIQNEDLVSVNSNVYI